MSRRRTARTDAVVHGYWPHSDPEPPPGLEAVVDQPVGRDAAGGDEPCPGDCNREWRRAERAVEELVEARAARHRHTVHAGQPCPDGCDQGDEPVPDHDVPFHPGRPVWCVDVHAFNDRGEMLDTLDHRGCTRRILHRLRDLPALAAALTPGRLTTPRDADIDHGSTSHSGARALAHAPSPSPGWDTADELIRWAVALEDWLRDHLGDPHDTTRRPAILRVRTHTLPAGHAGPVGPAVGYRGTMTVPAARTLTAAVTYLHRHGTALLASPDSAQVGRDILDTHRRLERLVGHDRLTHRINEPCPRCGRKGLRRKDGDELVRCSHCPAVWDWDHFQLLSRAYADTVNQKRTS